MYDPALGRFHTQDRFAEKYFDLTPYHYGANDPIKHIDINGDSIVVTGSAEFKQKVNAAFELLKQSETGMTLYNALNDSENIFSIASTSGGNKFKSDSYGVDDSAEGVETTTRNGNTKVGTGEGTGGTIYWNSTNREGPIDENGNRGRDPLVGLGHEMAHGEEANSGTMNRNVVTGLNSNLKFSELTATHRENQVRSELGMPLRKYYGIANVVNSSGQVIRQEGRHLLINGAVRSINPNYNYRVLNPSGN